MLSVVHNYYYLLALLIINSFRTSICVCKYLYMLSVISDDRGGAGPPLEFFFQEQSYSSLHSGRSLARDHVRGDIDDPFGAIADFCGVIADFCGVIADPCGVVAIPAALSRSLRRSAAPRAPMRRRRSLGDSVNIKHC